jgi:hypothetical protein
MDDVRRPLHLLTACDALLRLLAHRGAHVVVERKDLRAREGPHDLDALGVVLPHNLLMVEEIDVVDGVRVGQELVTVRPEGVPGIPLEKPGIADRNFPPRPDHAFRSGVATIRVAPGEHPAVPVERRFHRRIEIVQKSRGSRVGGAVLEFAHGKSFASVP